MKQTGKDRAEVTTVKITTHVWQPKTGDTAGVCETEKYEERQKCLSNPGQSILQLLLPKAP